MVFRLVSLLSVAGLITACSIYKSADRKDFEGTSPSRTTAVGLSANVDPGPTGLGECQTMNAVPAWFVKQFPGPSSEILIANEDLEVWKQASPEGPVTVRSFRAVPNGTRACSQAFASDADWEQGKSAYLNLLASPVLD